MKNLRLVDLETGEDLTKDYVVRSKAQADAYKQIKEAESYRMIDVGKRWVASYHDPIRAIIRDLSLTEAGAIVKLLPFLRFKSEGKLINNGKPLKQVDIQRIIGRGRTSTNAIMARLQELGVVEIVPEGRSNAYFISAEFHTLGGVRRGASFTKIYQVSTRELIDDLDLHETGLLYKILPFFHFSEYYLCANPDEENPEIIDHLSRVELAELVGHDSDTVAEAVTRLQRKGAILATQSGRTVRYLVHPDVMFRQANESEWTQSVRKMFAQHANRRSNPNQ